MSTARPHTSSTDRVREHRSNSKYHRLELHIDQVTRSRISKLLPETGCTRYGDLVVYLLDFHDKHRTLPATSSEPVVDSVEVVTGNIAQVQEDQVEVVSGNITEPASEPVEVVTGNTSESAKQQALRLLATAGNSLSEAQALLKTELKSMFPGVAINPKPVHGSAEHDLFKRYDSVQKQLKKLSANK